MKTRGLPDDAVEPIRVIEIEGCIHYCFCKRFGVSLIFEFLSRYYSFIDHFIHVFILIYIFTRNLEIETEIVEIESEIV